MDHDTLSTIAFFLVAIFIIYFIGWWFQSADQYKEEITEELRQNGCQLVEIKIPELFNTGHFFAITFWLKPDWLRFLKGEKTYIRKITYKNKQGEIKESWVQLNIRNRKVINTIWRPEL